MNSGIWQMMTKSDPSHSPTSRERGNPFMLLYEAQKLFPPVETDAASWPHVKLLLISFSECHRICRCSSFQAPAAFLIPVNIMSLYANPQVVPIASFSDR